jgi:hypothetical protein
MKKILIAITMLSVFGCSVNKDLMSKEELAKWSVKSDTIFCNAIAVAVYDHSEFELNPSHGRHAKPIQELSITQIGFDVHIQNLITYIHTIHPKQKVEIVVPRHK